MGKMGKRIDDAKKEYTKLVTTRTNQLEKPLNKIEGLTNLVASDSDDTAQSKLEGQQKL